MHEICLTLDLSTFMRQLVIFECELLSLLILKINYELYCVNDINVFELTC